MERYIRFADKLSLWVGHSFAWCVVILTAGICYEVFVRYALRAPTAWAFDLGYTMYGALFFMSGAYTLSRGNHVRGDILYRMWKPRTQARFDLVLYFLFFFPGIIALVWAGITQAEQAWRFREVSVYSPAGFPVYPLRTLLPIGAFLLLLQGAAEVCRSIICIRTGEWPARLHDVEELENQLLQKYGTKTDSQENA